MSERKLKVTADTTEFDKAIDDSEQKRATSFSATITHFRRMNAVLIAGIQASGQAIDTSYLMMSQMVLLGIEVQITVAAAMNGATLGIGGTILAISRSGQIIAMGLLLIQIDQGKREAAESTNRLVNFLLVATF
ncbi:MAG: hypothetical protein V3V41_07845 [Candidatus Heimdallarchaeota archaeon]